MDQTCLGKTTKVCYHKPVNSGLISITKEKEKFDTGLGKSNIASNTDKGTIVPLNTKEQTNVNSSNDNAAKSSSSLLPRDNSVLDHGKISL